MSSLSSIFSLGLELPTQCHYMIHKPSNDPTALHCIIISTDFEEYGVIPGIYKYNLETNETLLIYEYGRELEIEAHGQFIDKINHLLCLFGGYGRVFIAFDLQNNEIKLAQNDPAQNDTLYTFFNRPTTVCIPHPMNQIHILQNCKHYKFNIETNKTIKDIPFSKFESPNIVYPHFLYVAMKKQLIIFGGSRNGQICNCDIEQNRNQNNYEWKVNKLKMPHRNVHSWEYEVLLGFANVLFVFYFQGNQNNDIYLLDLSNDKWFKSKYCVPDACSFKCSVVKNNDNVHFLDFSNKKHFKVCLYDLIPNELVNLHKKYYKSLIMGYLREKENDLSIAIFPFVLKLLILNFFQLFS